MPFESMKQMRWMFKNKPAMAKKWVKKYGAPKTHQAMSGKVKRKTGLAPLKKHKFLRKARYKLLGK